MPIQRKKIVRSGKRARQSRQIPRNTKKMTKYSIPPEESNRAVSKEVKA